MPYGRPFDGVETWRFPARVERVVDGDTLDLMVDLGFRITRTTRFRLFGVDTAEIYGVKQESEEYTTGSMHRAFVHEWLADHDGGEWPYVAWTAKETGKYGRYVAELLHRESDASLNRALVDEFGDAVAEYDW